MFQPIAYLFSVLLSKRVAQVLLCTTGNTSPRAPRIRPIENIFCVRNRRNGNRYALYLPLGVPPLSLNSRYTLRTGIFTATYMR